MSVSPVIYLEPSTDGADEKAFAEQSDGLPGENCRPGNAFASRDLHPCLQSIERMHDGIRQRKRDCSRQEVIYQDTWSTSLLKTWLGPLCDPIA